MAVPSQPVICEVQCFSHVLEKLPTAIGGRLRKAVAYTCVDASETHLAVGSEQGFVYVVNISSGKIVCKLSDYEGREQITQVKLNEKYGYAAYGTKEGTLRIEPATKSQATKKYTVCEQEKQSVTALVWSRDEPVLYCGYTSGKLVQLHLSFKAETMQATRLPDCGSEVVQLSVWEDLLLISTMARAFLLNTNTLQITQVGRKDRKVGCYGGTFACDGSKVLVARPGLRVFIADSSGQVLHTCIFRDNIDPQAVVKISAQQLPVPAPNSSWQFTFMIPWVPPLVVTYQERLLWVLDLDQISVVGFVAVTHNISSVCICGSILYMICNGCNPLVTRLTLSEGFVKAKQRGTSADATPQSKEVASQPGAEGQGNDPSKVPPLLASPDPQHSEEAGQKPFKSQEGGLSEDDKLSALSNGDQPAAGHCEQTSGQLASEAKHQESEERMQVMSLQNAPDAKLSTQDGAQEVQAVSQDTPSNNTALSPVNLLPEPKAPTSPPLQATPDRSEALAQEHGEKLKSDETLGQDYSKSEEEHAGGRTTIKGKLKPILSNLLSVRGANEGVVSGLKDILKPNMTLITGLLHKEAEVSPMGPTPPATPVVAQLDEKELERIVKMATAEEEESLHVRVGGEQKRKSKKSKRTHKTRHPHAHPEGPSVGELSAVSEQSLDVEAEPTRAGCPPQDLSVTTPAAPQTPEEHRQEKFGQREEINSVAQSDTDRSNQMQVPKSLNDTHGKGSEESLEPIQGHQEHIESSYMNSFTEVQKLVIQEQNTSSDLGDTRTAVAAPSPQQECCSTLDQRNEEREITAVDLNNESALSDVGHIGTPSHMETSATDQPSATSTEAPSISTENSPVSKEAFSLPVDVSTFSGIISPTLKEACGAICEPSLASADTPTVSNEASVDLKKSTFVTNKGVESPFMSREDDDARSDGLTKSTGSFTDPLGAQTESYTKRARANAAALLDDNPLYMHEPETGGISDDSCSRENVAETGKVYNDSPQSTRPIQVVHSGNGTKGSEVAGSPLDTGSSSQGTGNSTMDDFIDPLNPGYETSQDHNTAPKGSGEEADNLHNEYVIPEVPKIIPQPIAIQKSGGSATSDIWCQLPNPSKHHLQCFCISDQLAWAIDNRGTTFYSSITSKEIAWHTLNKPVTYIATSASGKVVWGIHKGMARARTGFSTVQIAGTNWKNTTKANITVKLIAVDEDSVWVLKSDGKVMQRRGVTPLIPDGIGWNDITGSEVITFSFIACCNRVVWALDTAGRPYVRTGISSANISGTGWAAAKSPPLNTVSITSNGTVWVIDKEGVLGFRTGASPDRPEGKGKWWEVAISTQAPMSLVHRLRNVEAMAAFLTMSTEQQSIMSVSASANAGVCVLDSSNKLHACWRSVTGYRYKKASKDGMFEVTIWNKVSTSHLAKWLVRYDGGLYCLTTSRGLFPIELVSSVQHIATSPTCIWVVALDEIWSRQGMTPEAPEGISWDYIELSSQMRERKIQHIACSEYAAWVIDNTGVPHFRFGVHPREKGTGMSPAWIPVDGKNKPFVHMAVSPDGLVVWAVDEEGCPYARTFVTKDFPVGHKWEPVQPEPVQKLCAANGKVFAISKKGELLSRMGITQNNPVGNYWRKLPGKNYTFISTTPSAEIWVIDAEGGVFVQMTASVAASTELSSTDIKDLEDGPETSETKDKWEVL